MDFEHDTINITMQKTLHNCLASLRPWHSALMGAT